MNKDIFERRIKENAQIIDQIIPTYFDNDFRLKDALIYAMDSGKRVRASLYFETLKMLGKEIRVLDINFALSLELIHGYSLVHDDLPAMDNDDMRRGKPSTHKKFGEDIGILTGDGLLNEASSLLLKTIGKDKDYLKAASYLMDHAGYKGMIEGQVLDLRARDYDLDYLLEVYNKKTAYLFMAAVVGAGLNAGISDDKLKLLEDYAYNLGLAYQIQDDLLEDVYDNELNILNICQRDEAISLLDKINDKARGSLRNFDNNDFLLYLIDYLSVRED